MNKSKQSGAALVVSLMLLVVMTILAVSSINTSSVNLLIVHNLQETRRVESAVQQAIEQALSSINTFNTPGALSFTNDGLAVDVDAASCIFEVPASGYSATWTLAPIDSNWELTAGHTNTSSGAQTQITQGVAIRLVAGSCI